MKKIILNIFLICFLISLKGFCNDYDEVKQQAIALYSTKNYQEAFSLLENLPANEKDKETFLLLANISQDIKNLNTAIQYLNKALDKDYTFYKAYYNLGCIFASKKSYFLASNNFELTIKYNKDFAPAYYNLAYCQMKLKDYEEAKKNLIKALELEPNNKDAAFNLAYCYKQLNKTKQAKKIVESLS